MDKDDQERMMDFIHKQIQKGSKNKKEVEYTELKRESEEEKIKVNLSLSTKKPATATFVKPLPVFSKDDKAKAFKIKNPLDAPSTSKRKSALDDIMREEETKKEKKNRKDYWLHTDIVVKIITKSLGDKYYKKKGVVESVENKFAAKVRLFETNDLIKLDQEHLETVIPSEGKLVKIVNGAYRGDIAKLKEIHTNKFCATLEISSGVLKGRIVNNVTFEDFSKLHRD